MIRRAAVLGLIGLAIATGLFIWHDFESIFAAFLASGVGILIMSAAHFIPMLANARAWQILVVEGPRPSLAKFFWAVWLREAVNGLLPVARVGGEVVTARLLKTYGMSMPVVIASLAADVTICIATQFLFTIVGIGLFLLYYNNANLTDGLIGGAVLLLAAAVAFYFVQRKGIFRVGRIVMDKMFGDRFAHWTQNAEAFDDSIRHVYRHRRAVIACAFWQFLGWMLGALEIAIALYFLNQATGWLEPVVIESLVQAASSSAFMVPGALGVQEGAFEIVGGWVGVAAQAALALALMRRARDILLFVPALIFWQLTMGKKLLTSRNAGSPAEPGLD